MSTTPLITPTNQKSWKNRHDTFKQQIDNLFDIANGNTGNNLNDYNATTAAIRQLIGRAIQQNKRLRALGGGWSWTKVAATEGWILNTKQLNMRFPVSAASISGSYQGNRDQLLFAQCGNSIQELNTHLKQRNKSLKNCGASNGQTIVGAFSTGTHGSAIDAGSTPDFIVGLHIIISADEHIWLERESYPVAADAFIQKLQTRLVRNDDLFNAALVSFGSFGFIHGVMIETEEIYLLECYRIRLPLEEQLKHVMETLDFSNAAFMPHGSERPFHFQIVVNQYDMASGAYATIMYKRKFTPDYTPPVVDVDKAGPGDDVPAFLGKLTDLLPSITPQIVNKLIKTSFLTYRNVLGTLGEIFTNNDTRGRVLSTALGVPISFVNEVNTLLIELNKRVGPFSGVLSYRYVKKSSAMIGFTKFDHTCIIELDGVESSVTRRFYAVVWDELERRNIPYTFHYGKVGNLNPARLRKMFPAEIDKWITARNKLLTPESMKIFGSDTLSEWGLDRVVSQLRPV
ncbi:MAG: FAD-binding protein [Chitinophagaceae bacterium]